MSVSGVKLLRFVEDLFRRFKDAPADVVHEPFLDSAGSFGGFRYGAGVARKALVFHKHRWVRTEARTERLSRTQIYVRAAVGVQDRITLPDGSQPEILSVEALLDAQGNPYFTEVFF